MTAETYLRFALALLLVLGLLGGLTLVLKRIKGRIPFTARARLKIVETLPLDSKTRLMIVRCDGQDHLFFMGSGAWVKETSPPDHEKVA